MMTDRICLYNIYGLNEDFFSRSRAVYLMVSWRSWRACDGTLNVVRQWWMIASASWDYSLRIWYEWW